MATPPLRFAHETLGQRVHFAAGEAADAVAEEVRRLDGVRVMAIASSADRAERVLAGVPVAVLHTDVVRHVPAEVAERAVGVAREHDVDVLVSVGGGSTTGLAKAVALATGLPIVAVPTTYAGSEATDVWGRTESGRKTTGVDPRVLPRAVVYDAGLMLGLPVATSVASGLNALAHCVDAMWGPRVDPIDQALAVEGIRTLALGLPAVAEDPAGLAGREQTLYGAYLAAVAFASAGSGLHHKICHVLGGMFDLPHAETHAVVLPHVLALNAPAVPELDARMAQALGRGEGSGSAGEGLQELYALLDAPRSLRELGLDEVGLMRAVEPILEAAPPSNPAPVTAEAIESLLRAAYDGEPARRSSETARRSSEPARRSSEPARRSSELETQAAREQELTDRVLASFADTPDPRTRELVQALTRHLHALLRETGLTEEEWRAAIGFLTDVGHLTDERRQEFILLSDVLGASMQTITINNRAYADATEATVFGPFFVEGSPEVGLGGDISGGDVSGTRSGEPCWVEGRVTDTSGAPLAGALVEAWEADADGRYDVQYDDDRVAGRGHLRTDAEGGYRFWAITPTPYPIPDDGPVGVLLRATGRSPMRAAHLHLMVVAEGCRTLVTHVFPRGDVYLDSDSVFGVRDSLVVDVESQPAGTPTPDGRAIAGPWSRIHFDLVLAPARP